MGDTDRQTDSETKKQLLGLRKHCDLLRIDAAVTRHIADRIRLTKIYSFIKQFNNDSSERDDGYRYGESVETNNSY